MNFKLPYKKLGPTAGPHAYRVIFFDPEPLYKRIGSYIDSTHRFQTRISWELLFPSLPGMCACGCGKLLTGKKKRFATKECSDFVDSIYSVIYGNTNYIGKLLTIYYGNRCAKCAAPTSGDTLYVDHIVAVTNGGGGTWLSNFQFLCKHHHNHKTNQDINFKKTNHLPKLPFNE